LISSSLSEEDSFLTDFLSTAISWKLPCQIYAHSPLLEAASSIIVVATGIKMITPKYSITGSYLIVIAIITSSIMQIETVTKVMIV
jgi:hypothetical protein